MGFAGSLGLVWLALGALRPSPPAAGEDLCPHPLNGTHCRCPPGFEGPPWHRSRSWERHCEDINECLGEGRPPCPPSQSCHNTEGGFRCECNRGYRPRGTPETGNGDPETGNPKNGSGNPENGSGTPKNGSGTPKNGPGTPENGNGNPENGNGNPGNGNTKNGNGTPKNGNRTPENGTGNPKNGPGNPKNGSGTPENGHGTPGNGTGTTENGNVNGNGNPENGTGTPENGNGTPKNGTGTPENGNGNPENGTGTPENGNGNPGNGNGTPKNGAETPKNGTGTTENGAETPKNGTGTPENDSGNPENGNPKNGSGNPENGSGTPGNGAETPENGTIYCEDVDECAEGGEGLCGGGSVCLNTPGSFECHCPPPGRGPPGPEGCPAVPLPPEICAEEEGCVLGETLARIERELRGGRDPRSVLQELLLALGGALGGSLAAPPPWRFRRVSALLAAGEGLARAAGTRLPPGTVTNVTAPRAALSLAVSRGPPPGPVTLAVPEVTLEVPPEVALDEDSGLSLVALLTLGGLPEALSGAPPVRWGGWGSLPRAPRRGRAFPRWRPLSPAATAFVTRPAPRGAPAATLRFRHPPPDPKLGGQVLCAFWNPQEGRWDSGGCRVVPPENGSLPLGDPPGTVCACDHLTSFAVLLAFNEIQDHWLLDLVTQVALAVSVVALVAAAATFALCRALAEPRRTLQLHLSLSLLAGQLAFLLGIDRAHSPVLCRAVAVALHLSWLSAFSWMALQGVHLYVLLVQVFPPAWLRPRALLALGYGPALLLVAVAAAAFPGGYGTHQYCWLSLQRGFRWSFQGPVIVITAANAAILVVTLWKLLQKFHEVNADMGHLRRTRVLLVTSLGQLSLLGSGWALGVGAGLGWAGGAGPPLPPGSAPPPLPLLFCLVNGAQGLLIFLCHCLGHPKVRGWYRALLCPRWRPYSEFTSHTSNTSNHTSHTSVTRGRSSQGHQ